MSYLGCMLAQEYERKRIEFPVAVEDKYDGFRITFVDGEGYTRNGKTYETLRPFAEALREVVGPGVHVDCELVGRNWNETSKLLKRIKDVDVAAIKANVTCVVFDVFNEKMIADKVPYGNRRAEVVGAVAGTAGTGSGYKFKPSFRRVVNDEAGLEAALQYALRRGLEGVMVKPLDAPYVCKRSFAWLKMKPFKDITLTIVGAEESRGKCQRCSTVEAKRKRLLKILKKQHPLQVGDEDVINRMKMEDLDSRLPNPMKGCAGCGGTGEVAREGLLGAFLCKDEKGTAVKVGGGYTDAQRKDFWKRRAKLLGKKIDVKVQDEKGNDIVARFPVFMRFRDDV